MRQIDFSNQRELGERNERRNRYFLSIYLAELGLAPGWGWGAGRDLPDRLCLGCEEQECDRQVKRAR